MWSAKETNCRFCQNSTRKAIRFLLFFFCVFFLVEGDSNYSLTVMRGSVVLSTVATVVLLCAVILLPLVEGGATTSAATTSASRANTINFSSDVACGIFVGLFCVALLIFAIVMMMDIQASDKIAEPKREQGKTY